MSFSVDVLTGKKAFVWDFDGSFCDTERLHYKAYAAAFAEWGFFLEEEGYYLRFTHYGDGARSLIEEKGLAIPLEAVLSAKKRHYMRLIAEEPLSRFNQIETILTALGKRGKIAIASNSPRDEIDLILERSGLAHYPSLIVGREGTLRKKPFPDIFQAAYARLGNTPEEVLVFEDSERGLQAASASGAQSVLMLTPFNRSLPFQAPYVLACTHDELAGLLEKGA